MTYDPNHPPVYISKCTDANGNFLRAGYLIKLSSDACWLIGAGKCALMQIHAIQQYTHTDDRITISCHDISPSGVVSTIVYRGFALADLEFLDKKLHNFDAFFTVEKLQNTLCQNHFNRPRRDKL